MVATLLKSRWRKEAVRVPRAQLVREEEDEPEYKPLEWRLVGRLLEWLKPYWEMYLLGSVLGLIQIILDAAGPTFLQRLVDYVTGFAKQSGRVDQTTASWHVAGIVGLWATVIAGSLLVNRFLILIMTWAGENVQFDIRRRLFEHLQTLSMSYYDRTRLGRIISRCTSDLAAMREVNVWGIWQMELFVFGTGVAAAMLLYTDRRLFLAVCWLGPVIYAVNSLYKKKAMGRHQLAREGWTRVSTNLCENITGMRVVTAFDRQISNLAVFNRLQERNTENNMRVAVINGLYQPLLSIIAFIGRAIILLYSAYLVVNGRITVGAVVAAYLYWDWFMNPIINFGNFYTSQVMPAMTGCERVFNLLDEKPDVQDLPDARPLARIRGDVEFEHVGFGYKPERPVLHDISFKAAAGQTVALVGATGSGKSSIISLIARFYQPQSGRVLVDGQDIRQVSGESLHKQMGLVLQVNYLFTGTVMDNIRYARPDATDARVIEAAKALGTYHVIMALKDGFSTEVGERGASMSVGQRQLICFTRAYLADPRIFMLDEATSSVDTATELLVQKSLEKLLEGRTTFIVAHRLSTIMRADLILVIDGGRIIERGTHRQLRRQGGKYAQLYREFVKQGE